MDKRKLVTVGAVILGIVVILGILALQQCDGDSGADDTSAETPSATEETTATSEAIPPEEAGVEYHVSEVEVTGDEIAAITTPKGVIKFEFFAEDAPNHVASFIELADSGFYDGTKFHRVEPGFVVQGGDPLSRDDDPMVGTGGPGYQLRAEFNERPHVDGSLAMARSTDPDSAGSQFYITMGPQSFLDGNYTVFGQVVEGLDVVYAIQVGDPMESVTIERPE